MTDAKKSGEPPYTVQWILGILGTIIAAVVVAWLTQGGAGSGAAPPSVTESDGGSGATSSAGRNTGGRVVFTGPDRARDGEGFGWTVHKVVCGIKKIEGGLFEGDRPQGGFCRADVTVTNRSNTAAFPIYSHFLFSGGDVYGEYETDGNAFHRDIFPNSDADGRIYFDVPRRAAVDGLHLNAISEEGGAAFDFTND